MCQVEIAIRPRDFRCEITEKKSNGAKNHQARTHTYDRTDRLAALSEAARETDYRTRRTCRNSRTRVRDR